MRNLEAFIFSRLSRRSLLKQSLGAAMGFSLASQLVTGGKTQSRAVSNLANLGPLQEPDENNVRLPEGFRSRIVAVTGEKVANTSYDWHSAPDGGATFATEDGGWIYVCNSEVPDGKGKVSSLRFNAEGEIIDAYSICEGTSRNCAGGPTTWGTYLSCEEYPSGMVWECDPLGENEAVPWPALGVFSHEAVTLDYDKNHLYLTEDRDDGGLYRFLPHRVNAEGYPELSEGALQVAIVDNKNYVSWHELDDPLAREISTRNQIENMTQFRGGEGIWYQDERVYFATKGDDRVWSYHTDSNRLELLYDAKRLDNPALTGVDNITMLPVGDEVLVAEDGGNMGIVALTQEGEAIRIIELAEHSKSEVTGVAFSPDQKRIYFNSQRGSNANPGMGITFEVTGPFVHDLD